MATRNGEAWGRVRWSVQLAAAALALAAPLAFAEAGLGANGAKGRIDFRIVIPVVLRAEQLSEPQTLAIAQGDLVRGYIDVEEGASLVLTSNNRAGFDIALAFDPSIVSRVVAQLAGQSLESDGPDRTLHVDAPRLVREPLRVRYRIYLAQGARSGSFAWPLRLAFEPGA